MSNLLPLKNKKNIRKEYIGRLLIVTLLFSMLTLVVAITLSIPSYLLSKNKTLSSEEKTKFLESYLTKREESSVVNELNITNEKIKTLSLPEERRISTIINAILDKKNNGIKINGLNLRKSGNTESLIVGGEAVSRNNLISFRDSLKSVPGFSNVDLPISNLTKSTDINFSLEINLDVN